MARHTSWSNWAGNVRCTPRAILEPETVDDVRRIVARASERGHTVRGVGRGTAWSPLVATDGELISTRRLARLASTDERSITVEPGITVGALVDEAWRRGLSLLGTGVYRDVSIGGLAATGSHGTGLHGGVFADQIVAMKIVTASGDLIVIDESQPDLLDAARVSLGALGVVVELTIRAEPAFHLRQRDTAVPVGEVLERLPDLARAHDHVTAMWFPHTDRIWLKRWDRAERGGADRGGADRGGAGRDRAERPRVPRASAENLWRRALFTVLGAASWELVRRVESLNPGFHRSLLRTLPPVDEVRDSPSSFNYIASMPAKVIGSSYAVPLEDAPEAFRRWMALSDELARVGRYPLIGAVHVRFTGASRAFLSPAYDRPTAWIEAMTYARAPGALAFLEAAGELTMRELGGRPHWAKHIGLDLARVRALHAEGIGRFDAVRRRLDPGGTFLNELLAQLFGRDAPQSDTQAAGAGALAGS